MLPLYIANSQPPRPLRAEIMEGLFREQQLITLSGWMNVGKTPLLKDWAAAIASGQEWCGHQTQKRRVVILDFESTDSAAHFALRKILRRRGLGDAALPVEVYPNYGNLDDPAIKEMERLLDMKPADKVAWIENVLREDPHTLMFIDPIQLLFNIDKNDSTKITGLYGMFRKLLRSYPHASFLLTYNLKKRDRKVEVPPLVESPHEWLQETSGSIDILSRSDVRLGIDRLDAEEHWPVVVNGLRRDESMDPFILEPEVVEVKKGEPPEAGFRRADPKMLDTDKLFNGKMQEAWSVMEANFTIADLVAESSNGTAYRLIERAKRMGLVQEVEKGVFEKNV